MYVPRTNSTRKIMKKEPIVIIPTATTTKCIIRTIKKTTTQTMLANTIIATPGTTAT